MCKKHSNVFFTVILASELLYIEAVGTFSPAESGRTSPFNAFSRRQNTQKNC